MGHGTVAAPLRREEALAFIVERLARGEPCPTSEEIARKLGVGTSRAKQLVAQLVRRGAISKTPGSQRNLVVRDVSRAREVLVGALRRLGATVADPMGDLQPPYPQGQLPSLPPLVHIPDVD